MLALDKLPPFGSQTRCSLNGVVPCTMGATHGHAPGSHNPLTWYGLLSQRSTQVTGICTKREPFVSHSSKLFPPPIQQKRKDIHLLQQGFLAQCRRPQFTND